MEALIPITMFMCIAAVAILRPISKRVGGLLEVITRERSTGQHDETELARIRVLMEHVVKRMDLVEERLDFTERLVGGGRRNSLRDESLRSGTHGLEDGLRLRDSEMLRP